MRKRHGLLRCLAGRVAGCSVPSPSRAPSPPRRTRSAIRSRRCRGRSPRSSGCADANCSSDIGTVYGSRPQDRCCSGARPRTRPDRRDSAGVVRVARPRRDGAGGMVPECRCHLLPMAIAALRRKHPGIKGPSWAREAAHPHSFAHCARAPSIWPYSASAPPFRPPDTESPALIPAHPLTERSLCVAVPATHPLARRRLHRRRRPARPAMDRRTEHRRRPI